MVKIVAKTLIKAIAPMQTFCGLFKCIVKVIVLGLGLTRAELPNKSLRDDMILTENIRKKRSYYIGTSLFFLLINNESKFKLTVFPSLSYRKA